MNCAWSINAEIRFSIACSWCLAARCRCTSATRRPGSRTTAMELARRSTAWWPTRSAISNASRNCFKSRRHTIDPGEFPMTFTDLHDLSLGFLLNRLVEHQRHDVHAIERCVGQLHGDVEGHDLAQDILADARAHLQTVGVACRACGGEVRLCASHAGRYACSSRR